eukprot:CAMPEP_0202709256 /NCGR_PEP_ID=MMETSP1385-20130828/21379_1 /ASSEMBLY_ACC=CAM_ASM_000861 /TAXON_ID=933848 /ORGANISM="Elphidium margaritaceum" /LENGTH=100 /DNA_ID=CAMNT_0049368461 /DNA_START=204 /DNA_END=506 /DNA_ORIENTATION=-
MDDDDDAQGMVKWPHRTNSAAYTAVFPSPSAYHQTNQMEIGSSSSSQSGYVRHRHDRASAYHDRHHYLSALVTHPSLQSSLQLPSLSSSPSALASKHGRN